MSSTGFKMTAAQYRILEKYKTIRIGIIAFCIIMVFSIIFGSICYVSTGNEKQIKNVAYLIEALNLVNILNGFSKIFVFGCGMSLGGFCLYKYNRHAKRKSNESIGEENE